MALAVIRMLQRELTKESPLSIAAFTFALLMFAAPQAATQAPEETPDPTAADGTFLDERVEKIKAKLDGDDQTPDGEGADGWTSKDLATELRDTFEGMTDAERSTYFILTLAEVKLALGEHRAPPEGGHTFEMQAEFITSGDKVVALHVWGKSSVKDRARVFIRMRYPDPDKGGAVMSWRATLDRDGSYDRRFTLGDKKLHYGNYYLTAILDPRGLAENDAYIEGYYTDHRGKTYAAYWRGFQRRVLTFGTPQLLAVEEVQLKRYYVRMLEENLLPLYLEFLDRFDAFASGEEGIESVVVQSPELSEGPVQELSQDVFDPGLWRAFMDDEFRAFLEVNRDALREHKDEYLRPAYPDVVETLLLVIRNIDELSRRKSMALYRQLGLPPDPSDLPRAFPELIDPEPWQMKVDASIQKLRKLGIRKQALESIEEIVRAMGLTVPEIELNLPTR